MRFTVGEIAEATGGQILAGVPEAPAGRIATDTRALERGETFLALRGERHDGHAFLAEAVGRGAVCLVIDRPDVLPAGEGGPAVVRVADTLEALGALGRAARARLACPVIAITGSCGKTTLKEMIGQVLGRRLKGRLPPKSFNNLIGVPLTLLAAEEDDAFVVCEFGTNAPGEIASLARLARPTIGVVTLVGEAHLEGLGSLEGVAEEKGALVESLPPDGLAVLNADDGRVQAMRRRTRARVVTFGLGADADLRARDVIQTVEGIQFTLVESRRASAGCCAGTAEEGVGFVLPVWGEHHVGLALAASAVARELGVAWEETAEALQRFRPPPMRLAVEEAGGVVLVNDAYNANPESMRAALGTLRLWPERRKVFFCGDMRELGSASAAAHAALGRAAAEAGVKRLVCVGPEAREAARSAVAAGIPEKAVSTCATAAEAAAGAAGIVRPGDVVLVKGSRAVRMEQVAEAVSAWMRQPAGPRDRARRTRRAAERGEAR